MINRDVFLITLFLIIGASALGTHATHAEDTSPPAACVLGKMVDYTRIHNQNLGEGLGLAPTCMACSATATLENLIYLKTGKKIPLSVPYMVVQSAELRFRHLYEATKRSGLPSYKQVRIVDQDFVLRSAVENGIVPEEAWSPKDIITKWNDKSLNLKLMWELLRDSVKNKALLPYGEVLGHFRIKMLERSGPLPTSFVFEGKTYTPMEFSGAMLPKMTIRQLQVEGQESENKGIAGLATLSATKPLNDVLETIAHQVDSGISVPAVITYVGKYRNGAHLKTVGKPNRFDSRKIVKSLTARDYRHGVTIINYGRNEAGEIQTLIVQDTRGEGVGDQGLLYMDRTYFAPYLRRVQDIEIDSGH